MFKISKQADKRGILQEEVFTYRAAKDGKVFIHWNGRQVTALSGEKAKKFLSRIEGLGEHEAQLVMAKATGNFKRGNERLAKQPKEGADAGR